MGNKFGINGGKMQVGLQVEIQTGVTKLFTEHTIMVIRKVQNMD